MLRRVLVVSLVVLLGVMVAVGLTACFEYFQIAGCSESEPGEDPTAWFGRPPLTVCMQARGGVNPMLPITWDLGDGTTATGKQVTHTYTEVGEYSVEVENVSSNGSLKRDETIVTVAGEPEAAFTYGPYKATGLGSFFSFLPYWLTGSNQETSELDIQFDATSSYPNHIIFHYQPAQVAWGFGDGAQETVEATTWFGSARPPKMTIRHTYPAAGVYTVTLTLTDNLGYTDTVTQTITVGTPGDDDEDEVEVDDFGVGAIVWEPGDEEEDEGDCVFIEGTVRNNATVAAGVELTATAYGVSGVPVGTFTYWPAGATNIGVGVNYTYGFFLCDLSIPGDQVVTVEVVVSDVTVY